MLSPLQQADLCARALGFGMPPTSALLVVDVDAQRLSVLSPDTPPRSFPVSTAAAGLGEAIGSLKTPRGFHEIVERYGDGMPDGTVFESRIPTGEVLSDDRWYDSGGDRILTRILRLAGREPGFNMGGKVDTYTRMIYLHGTNQERYVGVTTSSHGCIRLKNRDVREMFDSLTGRPAWCWIGSTSNCGES